MPCKVCGSANQRKFEAEIAIHFAGLEKLNKPAVFVFPKIVICMDCGTATFVMPHGELRRLLLAEI